MKFFERRWLKPQSMAALIVLGLGIAGHGCFNLFNGILVTMSVIEIIIGGCILLYLIIITPNA